MNFNMISAARVVTFAAALPFAAASTLAPAGDSVVTQQVHEPPSVPSQAELRTMTARFAPADIGADLSALPQGERQALAKLVEAAKLMDSLFLRQAWAGNDAMLQDLARGAAVPSPAGPDPRRAEAEARLHYFL